MSWNWKFLSLILLSTLVDYFCGIKVHDSKTEQKKKFYVFLSVAANLTVLGFFKYYNFFAENLVALTSLFGWSPGDVTLNIVLPVGISFYTFQTMSYSIDIYRKEIEPERNILNFALFVACFPQLVAGPIERAKSLLPQIQTPRTITWKMIQKGTWMILWGYFLKIFVADNAGLIVDNVFAKSGIIPGGEALLGIYAFAFQIFGDFAGYSSIAIGVAALMGFKLRTNFLFPYFVTNPQDFWRNWHISLSTWLRDYLYIPLGGNRGSELNLYRNLFLTMLLGGIWHGAAWTFVIWGIYQGGILIIHRYFSPYISRYTENIQWSNLQQKVINAVKVIWMFQITCLGWLIFRANSVDQIIYFLRSIFLNLTAYTPEIPYYSLQLAFLVLPLLVIQFFQFKFDSKNSLKYFPSYTRYAIYLGLYYFIVVFGEFGSREFIYFQF
ncbi:MBOAT family O-acyltransferase [Gracilimonas sp.]|uniref:MBOAT family O-acyltransferase n=1 Tax=Gracilimonas sp. TaxID=1974203 RepID=UPI0025C2D9CF|nr:MBOAT family O-acyltransferase [Gracilimonas sp.]